MEGYARIAGHSGLRLDGPFPSLLERRGPSKETTDSGMATRQLGALPSHSDPYSSSNHLLRRLEAHRDACGAPRHNQVATGVKYFELNCIGEVFGTPI